VCQGSTTHAPTGETLADVAGWYSRRLPLGRARKGRSERHGSEAVRHCLPPLARQPPCHTWQTRESSFVVSMAWL
jgi:hypothetical protein